VRLHLLRRFFAPLCAAAMAPHVACAQSPRSIPLYTPPVWFETYSAPAFISPRGDRAINLVGHPGLLDIDTGCTLDWPTWRGFDSVTRVQFGANGVLIGDGWNGGRARMVAFDKAGPKPLTLAADARNPRWTTDGHRVLYMASGKSGTVLMAGDLASPRAIPLQGELLAAEWLPDGKNIVAVTGDSSALSTLWHIDSNSGKSTVVASRLDGTRWPYPIAVSPDGRRVLLPLASTAAPSNAERNVAHAKRNLGIYSIDVASGKIAVVVPPPATGDYFAPRIANGQLYWTYSRVDADVVVIPSTGGTARVVARSAQAPSWRIDGRQLGVFFGDWRIADWAINWDGGVVDIDTLAVATSNVRPLNAGNGEDFPPIWSPDGKWIAFHSHRATAPVAIYGAPGSSDDIWLTRAHQPGETTPEIRLTANGWEAGSPDWSRDGTRLLYTGWIKGGALEVSVPWIVTIDPATGKPRGPATRFPLPPEIHGASDIAWSPVDDRVAIAEQLGPGRQALWVLSADGKNARKLIEYAMSTYGGVAWSKDGQTVVYSAVVDGPMQLFSIAVAGGVPRQLTHDAASLFRPSVSPDGKWIAATRFGNTRTLMSVVYRQSNGSHPR